MDARRNRRARRARRGLTALLVALVVTATGAAPAGAQTAPFNTDVAQNAYNTAGLANGVVIVGDDALVDQGVATVAGVTVFGTGYDTAVSAARYASWVNYTDASQGNGNSRVFDYANLFSARLSVGALAMNDARLITTHPTAYPSGHQRNVMRLAVAFTLQHSLCLMLVNMQVRSGVPNVSVAAANAVNTSMNVVASENPGRVFVADWKTHSAGQTAWFQTGSALLTPTGTAAFTGFIVTQADALIDSPGC